MKTPDTEKCEHKVVKKYCFRCKRPDLAGNVKNTPDTAHAVYQSTEADKCPKCGEDHRLISRCKTPDTEEMEVVGTLHCILTDISSYEPDGEVYTLVEQAHKELSKLRSILSSRDTYWKEMVRKEVEGMRKKESDEEHDVILSNGAQVRGQTHYPQNVGWNQALDTLLDNLK